MGETVLESEAIKLMWGVAAVLTVSILALLCRSLANLRLPTSAVKRHGRWGRSTVFLLLWLLLPLALILLLSYRNPKFNPRYLMMVSPAFLLLIAGGLSNLAQTGSEGVRSARPIGQRSRLPYAISTLLPLLSSSVDVLAMIFLLATSAYAAVNWFTDPAFTKADFRGAARYVLEHKAADEAVILSSGHQSPVWDYYAPGAERWRLPDIDILDVNATLGYHTSEVLNRALDGKRGVWTVLWQDNVVDPNGFLPDFLSRAGQEQPLQSSFWHVGLRHYRLTEEVSFSPEPPVEHGVHANFGGLVELLGWSQDASGAITLYWEPLATAERDFKVTLMLLDAEGHAWGRADRRPAAYDYPTFRWQPGEPVFGRYDLPAVPGTPPGAGYRFSVGLYDEEDTAGLDVLDPAGNPAGKRVTLERVQNQRLIDGDVLAEPLATPGGKALDTSLCDGLRILGFSFDPAPLVPGGERVLTIAWRAEALLPDVTVRVRWLDSAGQVVQSQDENTFLPGVQSADGFPTSSWQTGDVVLSQTTLLMSPWASPGEIGVELVAFSAEALLCRPLRLLTISTPDIDRMWQAPSVQIPVGAEFESIVRIVGLDLGASSISPGTTLPVTVTWQALADLFQWELTGFVHLLAENGRVAAQDDHVPLRGLRPTRGWLEGEVMVDRYDLDLPLGLAPGDYQLESGLYLQGGTRLVVTGPETWRGQDSVLAGSVEVR
ncbi:MAG TPA: hypothetical protein VM537_18840 [Anaerolineae bacterium]|nr:hypothetical protein [Anaerolineae bacterium]